MPDREKVIRGLTVCTDNTPVEDCQKCPYQGKEYCTDAVMQDALALLREEPVEQTEQLIRCKDCGNRECEGRAGTIVCGITGDSHSRLWFCADGEKGADDA